MKTKKLKLQFSRSGALLRTWLTKTQMYLGNFYYCLSHSSLANKKFSFSSYISDGSERVTQKIRPPILMEFLLSPIKRYYWVFYSQLNVNFDFQATLPGSSKLCTRVLIEYCSETFIPYYTNTSIKILLWYTLYQQQSVFNQVELVKN